jgi:hypothetical protein
MRGCALEGVASRVEARAGQIFPLRRVGDPSTADQLDLPRIRHLVVRSGDDPALTSKTGSKLPFTTAPLERLHPRPGLTAMTR